MLWFGLTSLMRFYTHFTKEKKKVRVRLVHYNDYYMGIEISIIRNTLSWNVISITIH